jgi:phosphoglycolate phosphatase
VRVLLFDIDGTLILSGGAGARALDQAIFDITGLEGALRGARFDGATDLGLLRHALERSGQPQTPELVTAIFDRYIELLPAALASAPHFRLLPGVEPLLASLKARGLPLGLCTGNIVGGARAKLERGGLWERFSFGGYGSDAEARADIVRIALRRASEALGREVSPGEALVIGDTPKDVAAAVAAGVPSLGVATGQFSVEELRTAGADHAVESLEADGLLEWLVDAARSH